MILLTLQIVASLSYLTSAQWNIRLVGGNGPSEGRVEVYYNGEWGTVCDDEWDLNDAKVVCGQLGFADAVNATLEAHFGEGSGKIWMDDVYCYGWEYYLEDCLFDGWGNENCKHKQDAGVVCNATATLRLTGSSFPYAGTIEVLHEGRWTTICNQNWKNANARTVCRQLGYSGVILMTTNSFYENGNQFSLIYQEDVICSGTERRIEECLFYRRCTAQESVGVICADAVVQPHAAVRLTKSSFNYVGIVQFVHEGSWGVICNYNNWNSISARVFCRQLGYKDVVWATSAVDQVPYLWAANVSCRGDEVRIEDCVISRHYSYRGSPCLGYRLAAAICDPAPVPTIASVPSTKSEESNMISDNSRGYIVGIAVTSVLSTVVIVILIGIYFRRWHRSDDREVRPSRSRISAANPIALDLVLTPNRMHGQGSMTVNPGEWESDNVYNVLHHPTDQASHVAVYANKSHAQDYEQLGDELHPRFEARTATDPNVATIEYEVVANDDNQATWRRDSANANTLPTLGDKGLWQSDIRTIPVPLPGDIKPDKMYENTSTVTASANPDKLSCDETLPQSNIEYEEVVMDDQTTRDDGYENVTQPLKDKQYGEGTETASGTTADHYTVI